ncbi:I78 family peptidase inhibitor [Pseudomonas sp. RIT-PI-S]|uniref:I78 family peptidase inhibitor n=1 Tax=Pseudomonas sp. RIT-PI-S TaxID=3035295 RepID=UPI0021DB2C5F|nr:I78 family peptidase inhibitor [Pseudomonas sp. RIT-PI-S]
MGYVGKAGWALALTALLGGCSNSAPKAPASAEATPVVEAGRCNAEGAQFAVGQQASAALLEQAKARSGSLMGRILGPHDAVTMDYRSERLNLNADDSGKIIRANCG